MAGLGPGYHYTDRVGYLSGMGSDAGQARGALPGQYYDWYGVAGGASVLMSDPNPTSRMGPRGLAQTNHAESLYDIPTVQGFYTVESLMASAAGTMPPPSHTVTWLGGPYQSSGALPSAAAYGSLDVGIGLDGTPGGGMSMRRSSIGAYGQMGSRGTEPYLSMDANGYGGGVGGAGAYSVGGGVGGAGAYSVGGGVGGAGAYSVGGGVSAFSAYMKREVGESLGSVQGYGVQAKASASMSPSSALPLSRSAQYPGGNAGLLALSNMSSGIHHSKGIPLQPGHAYGTGGGVNPIRGTVVAGSARGGSEIRQQGTQQLVAGNLGVPTAVDMRIGLHQNAPAAGVVNGIGGQVAPKVDITSPQSIARVVIDPRMAMDARVSGGCVMEASPVRGSGGPEGAVDARQRIAMWPAPRGVNAETGQEKTSTPVRMSKRREGPAVLLKPGTFVPGISPMGKRIKKKWRRMMEGVQPTAMHKCQLCGVECNSMDILRKHYAGKKHARAAEKKAALAAKQKEKAKEDKQEEGSEGEAASAPAKPKKNRRAQFRQKVRLLKAAAAAEKAKKEAEQEAAATDVNNVNVNGANEGEVTEGGRNQGDCTGADVEEEGIDEEESEENAFGVLREMEEEGADPAGEDDVDGGGDGEMILEEAGDEGEDLEGDYNIGDEVELVENEEDGNFEVVDLDDDEGLGLTEAEEDAPGLEEQDQGAGQEDEEQDIVELNGDGEDDDEVSVEVGAEDLDGENVGVEEVDEQEFDAEVGAEDFVPQEVDVDVGVEEGGVDLGEDDSHDEWALAETLDVQFNPDDDEGFDAEGQSEEKEVPEGEGEDQPAGAESEEEESDGDEAPRRRRRRQLERNNGEKLPGADAKQTEAGKADLSSRLGPLLNERGAKRKAGKAGVEDPQDELPNLREGWCDICKVNCVRKKVLEMHIKGKKHLARVRQLEGLSAGPPPSKRARPFRRPARRRGKGYQKGEDSQRV